MGPLLTSLTEAVADGRAPDWPSLDLASLSGEERLQVDELRAVLEISRWLATVTSGGVPTLSDPGLPAPANWGPLELRERVGRGRFGDVYRAWDPAIARPVALKLLRTERADAASSVVVNEARLMGRVRHTNVATIYGAAHHEGRTGLWMEFVEGRTLEAELRERGPLPAPEAAAIGIELCRALAAVHAAGLVHRDVKAQNVMREAGGRVVLGDFGTGLDLDADHAPAVAGTPAYLAPEIFKRQPATPQSDLYSLGVLLFHLVTGSFPVKGRSISEIRDQHTRGQQPSTALLTAAVPVALREVLSHALDPDPKARFASADVMGAALTTVVAPPASSLEGSRAPRRRLSVIVLSTLTAVVTSGLVAPILWPAVQRFNGGGAPPGGAAAALATAGPRLGRVEAPAGQFWGQPSPDGRLFTFVDMQGDLGVFDPRSGTQRLLTQQQGSGAFAYESSTFSADGQQVAYAWGTADGARELRIVSSAGGTSRLLRSDPREVAHPLDWSEDGRLVLVRLEPHDGTRQLGIIDVHSGGLQRLNQVDGSHTAATISPDGRYVVFDMAQQTDGTERDVFVLAVAAPAAIQRLASGSADDFGPIWATDGTRVLFVSDRTGEPSVWAIDVHDGQAASVPVLLHRNIGRVTPYGTTSEGALYYALQVGIVDVFTAGIDLTQGRLETPHPVAASQVGSKMNADWSPDGRQIAYVLLPHGGGGANRTRRLVILDRATGERRVLNPGLVSYSFPQWSKDGRDILVKGVDRQSRRGVYLIDVNTGTVRPAAIVGGATPHEIGPVAWGADSRTLLLARDTIGVVSLDLSSGREQLLFRYADEGITRLTNGTAIGVAPDGRTLAYSAHRRTAEGRNETVLRMKPITRPGTDLWIGNVLFDTWTPDGQVLFTQYGKDWEAQMMSLWVVSPGGGAPRSIGVEIHGLRNVRIHPDAREVVLTSGFPGNELWALENFMPGRQ